MEGRFDISFQVLLKAILRARLGMTGRGLGIGIWGEMIVRLARPLWTEWALRDVVGPDDEGWTGVWMGDVE